MDSNFQVRISADISDLTSRLKAVEAELQKFSKAADGAAGAVKNMEQNANRGRLVAFAFGQVIRDAGFFANSFSLGILAISNNIPILIDQIALSVKALQPFAGAISIASSVLTAALTIWAYSSQAVQKNTESLDDYVKSLDDVREAQLKGAISADSEIRSLELLRRAAQDETFAKRERLKAVKELQERFPDYYASLSAEAIMAGKDADAHTKLANAIRSVANARAYEELIKENRKVELASSQKLIDLQAEIVKQEDIIAKSKQNVGSLDAAIARRDATNKIREAEAEIFRIDKERDKAKANRISLEKRVTAELEKQKSVSVITGDFGDAPKESKDASKALEDLNKKFIQSRKDLFDPSGIEFLPEDYKQNALDDLADFFGDVQKIRDEKLGPALVGAEIIEDLSSTKPITFDKNVRLPTELTDLQKMLGEAMPSIGEMTMNIVNQVANGFADIIASFADGLGQLLSGEMGIKEFGQSILQAISGFLSQLGRQMIAFGAATVAFGIAQKVLQEDGDPATKIKAGFGLMAAGAALSAAGGAIRKAAGGSSSSTSASPTPTFGSLTPRPAATPTSTTAMAVNSLAGGGVLETRVSGNDLVILMDRASKNRGEYF